MKRKAHAAIIDGEVKIENTSRKTFPTHPVNGDIWQVEGMMFAYVNGKKYQLESGKLNKFYKFTIVDNKSKIIYDSYEDDLNTYKTLKSCQKDSKVWLNSECTAKYYEITEKELE